MFEHSQRVSYNGQTAIIIGVDWRNDTLALTDLNGKGIGAQIPMGRVEPIEIDEAAMVSGIISNVERAGRKAAPLTTPGQTIAMQIDSTIITVQFVRVGAYTVTVYQDSYRVRDLCTSHPSEDEARDVARGIARSFVNDIFRLAA